MQIQSHLASTIAMAFDECVENPSTYKYAKEACERTTRWLERCKIEMDRLNSLPETINKNQLLFGINQGCTFDDLRIEHMKLIAKMDLDGYAVGGLAVGVAGIIATLMHGVKDAAVDRLQSVPHVGQGPAHDDGHGIFNIGFLHFVHQIGLCNDLVGEADILRFITAVMSHKRTSSSGLLQN